MKQTLIKNSTPNMVEHIINTWFGGVRANFTRWIGWPASTVQRRAESGTFTPQQQREILAKSDDDGLGITPADFFPSRLLQYQSADAEPSTAGAV